MNLQLQLYINITCNTKNDYLHYDLQYKLAQFIYNMHLLYTLSHISNKILPLEYIQYISF